MTTEPDNRDIEIMRLREQVRVLRAALEPFAAHATHPHLKDDDDILAKAALAATEPEAERETKERKERAARRCDVCGDMISDWIEPVVGKRVCRPCETKYFLGVD